MVADVLELDHQVVAQFLVHHGDSHGAGLILKEVAIVRGLKLDLQIWRTHKEREGGGGGYGV